MRRAREGALAVQLNLNFASGTLTLGEVMGCDLEKFPKIARWLRNTKACKLEESERSS
jgi:hypothetical protein